MALKDPTPTQQTTKPAVSCPPDSGAADAQTTDTGSAHHVVLVLARFKTGASLWGLGQLMGGPFKRRSAPGLVFQKVLGSGQNAGFGLRPGLNYQGLFSVFDTIAAADDFVARSVQVRGYRDHAEDLLIAKLTPLSCRGAWSGFSMHPAQSPSIECMRSDAAAPQVVPQVASLTRASIRPFKAIDFWAQSPDAEADLAQADGCDLAVGLGEAPILRQATFSLWQDQAAMDAYARSGAHQRAIKAAYGRDFFSESMFVRFAPRALHGQWKGRRFGPLASAS